MSAPTTRLSIAALALACAFASISANAKDDDYLALASRFDRVASDPVLGSRAPTQMERARAALAEYKEAGRRDRERLAYLVARRIDIAQASAEAEYLESQRAELQRENDRLQLASARREAAQARAELERQRLQAQIRAEESERMQREAEAARVEGEQAVQAARAEADQAKRIADAQAKATALAKKEAELSAAINGSPAKTKTPAAAAQSMNLPESVFAPGKATLAAGARAEIAKAVALANADAAARVRVEVTAGDRALAQQRAEVLRNALVDKGVSAARIGASGSAGKPARIRVAVQPGKS